MRVKDGNFLFDNYDGLHFIDNVKSLHTSNEGLNNSIVEFILHLQNGIKIPKKNVIEILSEIENMMQSSDTLTKISIPPNGQVIICGDTHGQFYDVCKIFEIVNLPSTNNIFIFNGDIVDRGEYSFEITILLFLLKIINPLSIYINRGNHEYINVNKRYGFKNEMFEKYDNETFNYFNKVFDTLPLAAIINNKIFVCHGGLSENIMSLDEINSIDRFNDMKGWNDDALSLLWSGIT